MKLNVYYLDAEFLKATQNIEKQVNRNCAKIKVLKVLKFISKTIKY